jgi:hypothetical protein
MSDMSDMSDMKQFFHQIDIFIESYQRMIPVFHHTTDEATKHFISQKIMGDLTSVCKKNNGPMDQWMAPHTTLK